MFFFHGDFTGSHLRKHLFPNGPKAYPTVAQKHLNGADSWNKHITFCVRIKRVSSIICIFQFLNWGIGGTGQMAKESLFASICKWSRQWTCIVHWRQGWIWHYVWTSAFWCLGGMITGCQNQLNLLASKASRCFVCESCGDEAIHVKPWQWHLHTECKQPSWSSTSQLFIPCCPEQFPDYIGCLYYMCMHVWTNPHKAWQWKPYMLRNFDGKFDQKSISILADTCTLYTNVFKHFSEWSFFEVGPRVLRHGNQDESFER